MKFLANENGDPGVDSHSVGCYLTSYGLWRNENGAVESVTNTRSDSEDSHECVQAGVQLRATDGTHPHGRCWIDRLLADTEGQLVVTSLLDRPLVPIANVDDAVATYEELRPYLLETEFVPVVVHVIEKAGGAPDKAAVEQRRDLAEEAFMAFRDRAETDGVQIETELLYGTDIAATIHEAAEKYDASAIVFRSRGGGRWLDFITGNVRTKLIEDHDQPVVVLPTTEDGDGP